MSSTWIKCTDRMPPLGKYVLVCVPSRPWTDSEDDPRRLVAKRTYYWKGYSEAEKERLKKWNNDEQDDCWDTFGTLGRLRDAEVTHWCEIPQMPASS